MSTLSHEMLEQLEESARKFITNEYSFEQRQALAHSPLGYSQQHWQKFAELGWLALPFEESLGGLGGNISDLSGLLEQFGRGLVIEPYLSNVVIAGRLIAQSENSQLKEQLMPELMAGEKQLSLAWEERQSAGNLLNVQTTATQTDSGYLLNGEKITVLNGPQADSYIVSALCTGSQTLGLFIISADSLGLTAQHHQLYDGHRVSSLHLNNVEVSAQSVLSDNATELLEQTATAGIYALSCEALGCMETLLEMTVEYTKIRKQFRTPIANFQALRHIIADMYVILKKTRCLQDEIGAQWATQIPSQQDIAVLKTQIGKAVHFISRNAIQLHGGIGMTDELPVGHYVKRLTVIDRLFGNSQYHLASVAKAL